MKKSFLTLSLILAAFSFSFSSVSDVQAKPVEVKINKTDETTEKANELGMAVYWYQTSGEAKALYQQGFNAAKIYFDNYVVKPGMKKAVVVDLDETMMDNSEHSAYQFFQKKGFDPVIWTKWVNSQRATATMGAMEYNNYVNTHGGTMFYVSNRKADVELKGTVENLQKLGFVGATTDKMLFKTNTSKKQDRYAQIKAMGYEIVQYIGDNLNDFTDETYNGNLDVRNNWVKEHAHEFGTKYIILPNPLYGGFEDAAGKTLKDRHDALKLTDWYK